MVHLDPDGQGVVYLWPNYGSGFQTFYTSPQSRSYPCLIRVVPYGFMVYLDLGARYMVYLQPQQRMVPSKSPLQISNKNIIFFFSQVSIQKGSSESFFGPTKGVPQNDFIFVPFPRFSPGPIFLQDFKDVNGP